MNLNDFDQLQTAFTKACRLSDGERSLFVEDLRQKNIEFAIKLSELLEFDEPVSDPLESICAAHRQAATVFVGRDGVGLPKVQGYSISHCLGRGNQADVFLANQASSRQPVALKIFRSSQWTEPQRSSIDASSALLARLGYPNILRVLDHAITESGRDCLITRYVEGEPIDRAASQMLDDSPVDFLGLFAKVAETLTAIHLEGIVHGNLKPANILVAHDGQTFLLDIDYFRLLEATPSRLLAANSSKNSILWAAPEQVDESSGRVDHRTDLYSLGVVLYQSLSGQFPYPVDGGTLRIAEQIALTPPAPVIERSENCRKLTADLASLTLRLLQKQQKHRFQSARRVANEFRKLAKRYDSQARNPEGKAPKSRFWGLIGPRSTSRRV